MGTKTGGGCNGIAATGKRNALSITAGQQGNKGESL